jgi:NADPH2:quinone reductase
MQAVQVKQTGGPEVMQWVDLPNVVPGANDLAVDVAAAGVNFIDVYMRSGVYDRPLPFTPGLEMAGTVSAVGEDVEGFAVGDRVASVSAAGTYAEQTLVGAGAAYHVPDAVDLKLAAAVSLQGFTAHYLVNDTFPLEPGQRCLVHAGAGGVGGLLIQVAKQKGAEVFATVGSSEKAEIARAAGADHVIEYREVDFAEAVRDIAGERPLDVVYDGVGKSTFDAGLTLLRPRGMLVLFGGASGQVPPFNLQRLNQEGSLFVTRPSLFHYMGPGEGQQRANEVFGAVADGSLNVRIGEEFSMREAPAAHVALEGRATTGKVVLLPS